MNRDQALTKIKKCLAMARGGTEHEAAAALRQAQALMRQHGIEEKDVALADVSEARAKACSASLSRWEVGLKNMIADAFGCTSFSELISAYSSAWSHQRRRYYVFVGVGSGPSVAAYAYEVLSRQCARARMAHIAKQPRNCKAITKSARGDAFAEGWVAAVSDLVDKFANPERNEQLLLEYMQSNHPDLQSAKTRSKADVRAINSGHQLAGFNAGRTAKLDRGIGGLEERALLT